MFIIGCVLVNKCIVWALHLVIVLVVCVLVIFWCFVLVDECIVWAVHLVVVVWCLLCFCLSWLDGWLVGCESVSGFVCFWDISEDGNVLSGGGL